MPQTPCPRGADCPRLLDGSCWYLHSNTQKKKAEKAAAIKDKDNKDPTCTVCNKKLSQHDGKKFCKKPSPAPKADAKAKAKGGPASRKPLESVKVVGEGRDYLNMIFSTAITTTGSAQGYLRLAFEGLGKT